MKLNLDSLHSFLMDIQNAVIFVAIRTFHHSIIHPEDLKKVTEELSIFLKPNQIFSESEFLRYNAIVETKITKLVFSLDFPLVYSNTFELTSYFPFSTKTIQ